MPCLLTIVEHLSTLEFLSLVFSSATGLSSFSSEMLSLFARLDAEVHGPLSVTVRSRQGIEVACLRLASEGTACFDMRHAELSPEAPPSPGSREGTYSALPRAAAFYPDL